MTQVDLAIDLTASPSAVETVAAKWPHLKNGKYIVLLRDGRKKVSEQFGLREIKCAVPFDKPVAHIDDIRAFQLPISFVSQAETSGCAIVIGVFDFAGLIVRVWGELPTWKFATLKLRFSEDAKHTHGLVTVRVWPSDCQPIRDPREQRALEISQRIKNARLKGERERQDHTEFDAEVHTTEYQKRVQYLKKSAIRMAALAASEKQRHEFEELKLRIERMFKLTPKDPDFGRRCRQVQDREEMEQHKQKALKMKLSRKQFIAAMISCECRVKEEGFECECVSKLGDLSAFRVE